MYCHDLMACLVVFHCMNLYQMSLNGGHISFIIAVHYWLEGPFKLCDFFIWCARKQSSSKSLSLIRQKRLEVSVVCLRILFYQYKV